MIMKFRFGWFSLSSVSVIFNHVKVCFFYSAQNSTSQLFREFPGCMYIFFPLKAWSSLSDWTKGNSVCVIFFSHFPRVTKVSTVLTFLLSEDSIMRLKGVVGIICEAWTKKAYMLMYKIPYGHRHSDRWLKNLEATNMYALPLSWKTKQKPTA